MQLWQTQSAWEAAFFGKSFWTKRKNFNFFEFVIMLAVVVPAVMSVIGILPLVIVLWTANKKVKERMERFEESLLNVLKQVVPNLVEHAHAKLAIENA